MEWLCLWLRGILDIKAEIKSSKMNWCNPKNDCASCVQLQANCYAHKTHIMVTFLNCELQKEIDFKIYQCYGIFIVIGKVYQ